MNNTSDKIGVIVGRFQTDKLHSGHRYLIDTALKKFSEIIIFLGISPRGIPTKTDPLSFEIRKNITFSEFADHPRVKIFPIHDHRDDAVWSKQLDAMLKSYILLNAGKAETLDNFAFVLGKDSFIDYYSGEVKNNIVIAPQSSSEKQIFTINASDIRAKYKNLDKHVTKSHNKEYSIGLVNGILCATQNQYNRVDPTVDIIPWAIDSESKQVYIAVGRKKNDPEGKWRFCGGFVESDDESYEESAARELLEEMNLETPLSTFQYVTSAKINDWRYRKGNDSIKTTCFSVLVSETILNTVRAGDDLDKVTVITLESAYELLLPEHQKLLNAFKQSLQYQL